MVTAERIKEFFPEVPDIVVERIAIKIAGIVAADIVEFQRRQRVAIEDFLAEYDEPCPEPRDGQQEAEAEVEVETDPDAGRNRARTSNPDPTDPAPKSEAAPDEMDKELPGSEKGNATSAWANLNKEERSTQMRLRWVKRRQKKSKHYFDALEFYDTYKLFNAEQKTMYAIISLAMNHASTVHEADSAMRKAFTIYKKAPYIYEFIFGKLISSWGNLGE